MICGLQYWWVGNLWFSFDILYFCLLRWSIVLHSAWVSARYLDSPLCNTKPCWRSVDAHFHDGVMKISCTVLPEKVANTSMSYWHKVTVGLPKMQDESFFTLHWCSCSGWGWERFTVVFAHTSGGYLIYGSLQPVATSMIQDTMPKIVDTLLMLNFRIGQWLCCFLFCL